LEDSSFYFKRGKGDSKPLYTRKPGPRSVISDEQLLTEIEELLKNSPWVGEGYRKLWARLRVKGIRVSQRRVLRVMRKKNLLAKERPIPSDKREHKGVLHPIFQDTFGAGKV